jgi:hypothetical protein
LADKDQSTPSWGRNKFTGRCRRETLEKHGLKPPMGYSVADPGNAVFSVSSFMDTLRPEEVTVEEAVGAAAA